MVRKKKILDSRKEKKWTTFKEEVDTHTTYLE